MEGEEGMQALRESVGRVPSGHGSGRDREARTCSETIHPSIIQRGSDPEGVTATKQQPRAKRISLFTPHLVPRVEEHLGGLHGTEAWRTQLGAGAPFS